MSFWDRVEEKLYEKKISEAELSRTVGLTQASIIGWKTKGSIPRADIAVKTAKLLGTSVEYLIDGSYEYFNVEKCKHKTTLDKDQTFLVPLFDQELSAGHGIDLPDYDKLSGIMPIPKSLKEFGENVGILSVKGDSMEPTISNGDLIICDSCGWDSGEGLYAIRLNGKGYIKRIQVINNQILIKSDNPKYESFSEPLESENFQIIGKAHYVIHHI